MNPAPNPFQGDDSPLRNARYDQAVRWFVPGYDASHASAAVLLRDRIGDCGRILVLGAGGGAEIAALAQESAGWRFVGVDPAADMLARAQEKLESLGLSERATWIEGVIDDAPDERFDAATALLVLHFLPDDGTRLSALRALHRRLKPGAPLLMSTGCTDAPGTPRFEDDRRVYAAFARKSGAPEEVIAEAVRGVESHVCMLLPEREEQLLAEAGFRDIRLFFVGLWFHGWIACA